MKTKTIAKELKKVVDEWLKSIKDENVVKAIENNIIITGGSIANMLIGEAPNDYDIYFTSKDAVIAVAEYYANKVEDVSVLTSANYHEAGSRIISESHAEDGFVETVSFLDKVFKENENRVYMFVKGNYGASDGDLIDEEEVKEDGSKYEVSFISANAISLTNKVQLVIRFYGNAEEIHENFDFVHATSYWTSKENKVVTNTQALESLLNRNLVYKGSKYPLASIFRTRKFLYRGWRMDAGQYLKMAFQLNDLELKDYYTLTEQLTGVDMVYFSSLLNDLTKDGEVEYSTKKIIKIIERIFEGVAEDDK